MDMHLDPEQELIRETAASFLASEFPAARLHQSGGTFDAKARARFAEMGWLAMTLSEGDGGVGYSAVEEMLVFRECGRVLMDAAVLPTVLATRLASEAGSSVLAREIAAGGKSVCLALAAEEARGEAGAVSGTFRVFAADDADCAVWVQEDEALLFDLRGEGLDRRPSLDKSTPMALVDLTKAPVLARVATANIKRAGRLLLAAYLQGASEAMRDMIVEYAKIRQTFGRPIGAYQAVRHPCAEMALRSEEARCQVFMAALALRDGRHDVDLQIDAAKIVATAAAIKNADANIQLHGGIGVTDEHEAHLYLKRVHMMSRWLGGEKVLLRRLVEQDEANALT